MAFRPPEGFNLADHLLLARLQEGDAEREAIRTDDASLSYGDVAALSARFGHLLSALGVRQEERVLIVLPDVPEFAGAIFGCLQIGAVAVMLSPELTPAHLASVVGYARAPVAIVSSDRVAALEDAASRSGRALRLLVVGEAVAPHVSFDDEASRVPSVLRSVPTHRDDPAIWLFSGGTTGAPKAVVQTHRAFAFTTECYARRTLGYRREDVTLAVPKLYFGYATGSNLFFPFSSGGTSVLFPEKPTPEVLFEKIARHRPTILVNVPSAINAMVSHRAASDADLSSLRFATSAGEALPEALYQRWVDAFGVELLDGLGTAEMWHIFCTNRPGDVRPGTLGRVVEGFEIGVRDEEGLELPDGEVGRLWVRGGARALGYWQDLERTEEAFVGEWFVGGDLVSRDVDGYVTHRGRADDAIKVKGKWLRPQEVESVLLSHPEVSEAAVIGVEDADGLLKPVAFVVAKRADGLEEDLKQHVLERLEAYKHPRRVVVLERLPTTHLGKVDRAALRRLLAEV